MIMRKNMVVLMLGLALSIGVTGCNKNKTKTVGQTAVGRFAIVQSSIKKQIDDKEKREHLLLLAEENRIAFMKVQNAFLMLMREGRKDHTISREVLEQKLAVYGDFRTEQFLFMAQNRMRMRKLLTKDEWNKIFAKPPSKKNNDSEKTDKSGDNADTKGGV